MYYSKEPANRIFTGYRLAKNSPLTLKMNRILHQLQAGGIISKLMTDAKIVSYGLRAASAQKRFSDRREIQDSSNITLTPMHFLTCFIILMVGIPLSLVAFVSEVCIGKMRKKH